ncbi:MAG: hypothetical protein AVO35_03895 [Candidatus Aegiribacteria sp. MLS_C]|nr:MAG: hypothetical protein AVO35_03895 [Candidatus Aegiribacteria sp. MLS_C]
MDEGRLVDLLLVRLSRDDEKQKVVDLLVSELGMTPEEAADKVANSPSILREDVEMEQGRILQDRMYPFVDLLPKYYKSAEQKSEATTPPGEDDTILHGIYSEPEPPSGDDAGRESVQEAEAEEDGFGDIVLGAGATIDDDFMPGEKTLQGHEEEPMVVTSASEEMITVQRCHICGRTPTNGEKLVPCSSCGELTCVDCYNRREHVCEKCASEGKTVDRPLDAPPESRPAPAPAAPRRNTASAPVRKSYGGGGRRLSFSPAVIAAAALAVLAAAFFIIDPMDIFSGGDEPDPGNLSALTDTATIEPADTLAADTAVVAPPDTTPAGPDSPGRDSTLYTAPVLALSSIRVPDSLGGGGDFRLPPAKTRTGLAGFEIMADSMQLLSAPLGQLLAFHSVELDGFALLRTENGYDILVMSILHPEPAERRAALLGNIGSLLDSTMVDQMVLYYRENQYYEPNMFSFTADSFEVLSLSPSPYFLQRRQALIPATTDLVTGPVFEWMTSPD